MSKTKDEIKRNMKKWIITFKLKKIVMVSFDKSKTKKDKISN